jgi:hypothetical protein
VLEDTETVEMELDSISRSYSGGWIYTLKGQDRFVYGCENITHTGAVCRAFLGFFMEKDSDRIPSLKACIGKTYTVFLVRGRVRSINGVLFL